MLYNANSDERSRCSLHITPARTRDRSPFRTSVNVFVVTLNPLVQGSNPWGRTGRVCEIADMGVEARDQTCAGQVDVSDPPCSV